MAIIGRECVVMALVRMKRANITEAYEGKTGAGKIYIRICSLPGFGYPSEALGRQVGK